MSMYRRVQDTFTGASWLVLGCLVAAAPTFASVDKCSKAVGSEAAKLQSTIIKRFQKCNDVYRKDLLKEVVPPFAKAAPACEKELSKLFDATTGAVAKSLAKLGGLVPKTCEDADLKLLGHLQPSIFGDRWRRFIGVTSVQAAYEQEITAVCDFPRIFQDLVATGNCPSCQQVTSAPCFEHACALGSGTTGTTYSRALPPLSLDLSGVVTLKLCRFDGITIDNEYVVAAPFARTLPAARIPQVGYLCLTAIAGEGYISCGGPAGAAAVNVSSCQDHVLAGTAGTCAEAPCERSTPDNGYNGTATNPGLGAHLGVTNGGECATLTTTGSVDGGTFLNNTFQVTIVLTSQIGPDSKPCTSDDTATPSPAITRSLTTGTANTQIQDADAVPFATLAPALPVTGSPFNCLALESSNLSGGALVEAFPQLHAVIGLDGVTTITLSCK